MLTIKMLPALGGDCIVIKIHRDNVHQIIIVDSGMGRQCNSLLLKEITEWNKAYGPVDLVILTHIDNDHVSGLIRILRNKKIDYLSIKSIWFNYGAKLEEYFKSESAISIQIPNNSLYTSYRQGRELLELLKERSIELIAPVMAGDHIVVDEYLHIDVLAPLVEDLNALLEDKKYESVIDNAELETSSEKNDYGDSVEKLNSRAFSENDITNTNASSIACLLSYSGHKILLLGDAKVSTIEKRLRHLGASEVNPLKIDYCKISHHGSKSNTRGSLISIINCDKYMLSTNWKSGKPSKECLSRIVMNTKGPVTFLCNYEPHRDIFNNDEYDKYKIELTNNGCREIIIDESNS